MCLCVHSLGCSMSLYSKRNTVPPSRLDYGVPGKVRNRIVAIFDHFLHRNTKPVFFRELKGLLLREYGALKCETDMDGDAVGNDEHQVVSHFRGCNHVEALDFVEACFRTRYHIGGNCAVDEIRRVFREEGIGYDLTTYRGPELTQSEVSIGPATDEDLLPKIIRHDNQLAHEQVIVPALQLLTHPKLRVANSEMLRAHQALRHGNFEEAITLAGSTFESVLKTICREKGWTYNEKDACGTLVDTCIKNGLCPGFYGTLLKAVCTLRNNLSSAHGRGPGPRNPPSRGQADHVVHVVSANLLLLADSSGL